MSHFLNITKKEVKEQLTLGAFISIIIMTIIFASMGTAISGIQEEAEAPPTIAVINEDQGVFSSMVLSALNEHAEVVYSGSSVSEREQAIIAMEGEDGDAIIIIPIGFSNSILNDGSANIEIDWIMEGAGMMDSISSAGVSSVIHQISKEISLTMIQEKSNLSTSILNPITTQDNTIFKGRYIEGVSPSILSAIFMGQSIAIPIMIMIIINMIGQQIIMSMGLEKENKTLETLLTMPVKRSTIIAGKITGSAIVGFVMMAIYMVGMSIYFSSFFGSMDVSGIDLSALGFALSPYDYGLVALSAFLGIFAGLSMCIVLGSFAKDYKSATTTYAMPVVALAMIPMFLTMFKDFSTLPSVIQAALFAIPFSHPMMAMRNLISGEYLLVIAGIVYMGLFVVAMIAIASWIFNHDILVTGRAKKEKTRRSLLRFR
jgi:ABC-2 type transport system permease protein